MEREEHLSHELRDVVREEARLAEELRITALGRGTFSASRSRRTLDDGFE